MWICPLGLTSITFARSSQRAICEWGERCSSITGTFQIFQRPHPEHLDSDSNYSNSMTRHALLWSALSSGFPLLKKHYSGFPFEHFSRWRGRQKWKCQPLDCLISTYCFIQLLANVSWDAPQTKGVFLETRPRDDVPRLLNTTWRHWMYQATKLLTLQHHRLTLTFRRSQLQQGRQDGTGFPFISYWHVWMKAQSGHQLLVLIKQP